MSNYVFEHQGKAFDPDGRVDVQPVDVQAHNRQVEAKELEWLKTGPEKVVLYVQEPNLGLLMGWQVTGN